MYKETKVSFRENDIFQLTKGVKNVYLKGYSTVFFISNYVIPLTKTS